VQVDRLDAVRAGAAGIGRRDVDLRARRGEDHHWHGTELGVALDAPQHVDAVDPRQVDVEDHDVGPRDVAVDYPGQHAQRVVAVLGPHHLAGGAGLVERDAEELGVGDAVLDEEDACSATTLVHRPTPSVCPRTWRRRGHPAPLIGR
jgi:hypothetical protein